MARAENERLAHHYLNVEMGRLCEAWARLNEITAQHGEGSPLADIQVQKLAAFLSVTDGAVRDYALTRYARSVATQCAEEYRKLDRGR